MILIAYRHGLRGSEVTSPRVSDVDLERGTIYCRRAKGSRSTVHPLKHDELAALERLQRRSMRRAGEYVFASERGERMTRSASWCVVAQAGERAAVPMTTYAHLLLRLYCCAEQSIVISDDPVVRRKEGQRERSPMASSVRDARDNLLYIGPRQEPSIVFDDPVGLALTCDMRRFQ